MPRIALSAHLARLVPTLPDEARVLLLKAFDKLRSNRFDAGLRVKKMRARPQVAVWEARVNGAGRLLFTYGHHSDRRTARPTLTAHCWTLVPDHDDVGRVLRRRSFQAPEAMSWVMGEELDAFDWNSTLPENPAADLAAIEQDFSESERWEAYAALSSDYQPALTTPPEHLPWYLDGPVAFADWAHEADLPAELLLSDEQVRLLRESLPLFVNGPAGSGKTTLALYKLLALQEADPDLRLAFVAHNPRLVARAEELFRALPTRPEKARTVAFLTYDALLAEVLGFPQTGLSRCVATTRELRRFLERHPLSGAERALFAADIRALVKGSLPPDLTPTRPEDVSDLLPLEVYRDLPLRWSALSIPRREEAYRLACLYQEHLQSQDLFDEQDLASRTLRALLGNRPRRYDVLVLDEVQDLTEKQLRVVLMAPRARRGTGLLLAGDPTQTLAESGFGWRIPRSVFAERDWDVPRPVTLVRSFRAGAPTLRLAQAIAILLKREGADVVSLDPEQARASGALPVRVAPSGHLDDALAIGRPDVIVLVANEDVVVELRQRWGHPFVWSVEEAKGLEADHVVLYQLPDRLRHLPGSSPAEREAAAQENRRVLRLHYVAATRARESVTVVVDPHSNGSLWTEEAITSAVSAASVFNPNWQGEPSAEEWRERGSYYRDFEQWAAAAVCYSRAGDEDWATALRALDESADAISAVGSIQSAHEEISTACAAFLLDHYGAIGDRPTSVWLLRQAGRIDEADALQAEHDEAEGNWEAAAIYYERIGKKEYAADLYERAGLHEKARACRPTRSPRKQSRSRGAKKQSKRRNASTRRRGAVTESRGETSESKTFPGDSPLVAATRQEDVEAVRRMLDNGVPIGSRGQCDLTALHVATWQRHEELTRLLLEYGADPNAIDEHMETPLYGAATDASVAADKRIAKRPLLPIVEMLLDAGGRPDAYSIVCRTPAKSTTDPEVRAVIEQAEVDFYRRNPDAPGVEETWPSLSPESQRLFGIYGAMNKSAGDHLPCAVAQQAMASAIDQTSKVESANATLPSATPVGGGCTQYSGGRIVALDPAWAKIDFGEHGHYKPAYDEFDDPSILCVGMLVDVLYNEQRGVSEWIRVHGQSDPSNSKEATNSVDDLEAIQGASDLAELPDFDELIAERSGLSVEQLRYNGRMLGRMMNPLRIWDFDRLPESWTVDDNSARRAAELRTEATRLKRVGDLDGALEVLKEASEYAPSHHLNYYNAGKVHYLAGNLDRAVAEYLKTAHLLVVEAHFVQIRRSRKYKRLFQAAAEATRAVTQSGDGMIYPQGIPGLVGSAADDERHERELDALEALWPQIYQTELDHHIARHAGHAYVDLHPATAKFRKASYVRHYADSIAGKLSRSDLLHEAAGSQQIESAYHTFGLKLLQLNIAWLALDPSQPVSEMLWDYEQVYAGTTSDEPLIAYWRGLWNQVR